MKKDLVLILLLILPAFAPLVQKGYFPMHDDLQSLRQLEMAKCFADGQVPCRWVPDMGYGYGYPLFNFYPPFPYLVGQVFHYVGFSYIDIVKIVSVLAFGITALGMYVLARELWGRPGGLLSSVMYTYAPYHSVDIYVRGAMNEFWAMAFFPWVLFGLYKVIRAPTRFSLIISAISISGLLLSHNPMTMIFAPVAALWAMYWWLKTPHKIRSISIVSLAGFLGLGLAAFFTLPVIYEQKYAHVETLVIGYFNYLAHFLELKQMFLFANWGYGESVYGSGDTMSFFVGYLHWIIPVVVGIGAVFHPQLKKYRQLFVLLAIFVVYSLFMAHQRSAPIWEHVRPLEYLQFPWRYLSVGALTTSLLAGGIALGISRKLVGLLTVVVLILNANFFHPRTWWPDMSDKDKFSGRSWQLLITSGIFDYLPKYAPLPPADPPGNALNITNGGGVVSSFTQTTDSFVSVVSMATPGTVEIQRFYFPGWRVWLNNKEVSIDPSRDPLLGRMQVDVPAGTSTLTGEFTNTPIRTVGNSLTLISLGLLLLLMVTPQPLVSLLFSRHGHRTSTR